MAQVLEERQGRPTVTAVVVGCLIVAALSLLLPSTITFDPLTWATWGREIVHLRLATDGGSAWKPLPVMVDVIFAPFGALEKWVWLIVARAGALLAVVMAYRLARRLAGTAAGLIAASGLLLSASFIDYLTPLGMSEPLLAGLGLLAIERHFDEHHAQAYGLIFACLLLRPEAFPFFIGYSIFLWRRTRRARPWAIVLTASLPIWWLLPDYLSTGDWLRSSRRAQMPTQGGPLLSGHPAIAVLNSALDAVIVPIVVGAALAALYAGRRYRQKHPEPVLLALVALCVGWVVEEALITQAHFGSGDQRYLIVGVALGCVLAGIGWTRAVELAASRVPLALAIVVALLASAPFVIRRLDDLSGSVGEIPYQAHKYGELAVLIQRAGGRSRILACGPVVSDIYQMPALAWQLNIHQSDVVIAKGPSGTPSSGNIVDIATVGTVFRTRTARGTPILPARLGSPAFHVIATTGQWQVLSTCP